MKRLLFLAPLLVSLALEGGEKSPFRALVFSLLPGGGQFYNGEYIKGAVFSITQTLCLGFAIREHIYAEESKRNGEDENYTYHIEKRKDWLWWYFSVQALSMTDAYVSAHFYKFDEDVGIELNVGYVF